VDAYTIQSYPGIADAFSATCLAQSMMLEWGVPTSTLGDMNTLLSVIGLMNLGTERVYYGDLQHIDAARREIKIIGDGACPPSLAGKVGPARFAEHGIRRKGRPAASPWTWSASKAPVCSRASDVPRARWRWCSAAAGLRAIALGNPRPA